MCKLLNGTERFGKGNWKVYTTYQKKKRWLIKYITLLDLHLTSSRTQTCQHFGHLMKQAVG